MPIKHSIWTVEVNPKPLEEVSLEKESLLEKMIVESPDILSDRWMLIGQQVHTLYGGYIDLLALNPDGQLIVIELKRQQTPRDVVAQAIDYASWVQTLQPDDIASIFDKFSGGVSLGEAFKAKFGLDLDEEQLNGSHQIVIVASSLDPSTERIVNYLNGMDVAVNVIFFQVFLDGISQYLSRAWLIDPVETEGKAISGSKGDWNGEYYVSFGHGPGRNWDEALKYGFISGGGGSWYSKTLFQLSPGDRIWANVPKQGFVGVGRVTGSAVRASEFCVNDNGDEKLFLDIAQAKYHRDFKDDEEKSEFFVPIEWISSVCPVLKYVDVFLHSQLPRAAGFFMHLFRRLHPQAQVRPDTVVGIYRLCH